MPQAPTINQELAIAAIKHIATLLSKSATNYSIPPQLADLDGFPELCDQITVAQEVTHKFACGDFEHNITGTGFTVGALKSIQANIRNLAWTCQAVTNGDFNLRVDYMGSLSDAFNAMIISLAEKYELIEKKQTELLELTENLKREIKKKEEVSAALERSEKMYREKSFHDALTGLYNRSYFFETASKFLMGTTIGGMRQTDTPSCLAMLDIDHFKKVNDTYGHLFGDEVLKVVAQNISSTLRKSDLLARYGGEEFVLLLTNTELERGLSIAERIREKIAQSTITTEDGEVVKITISIGLYECSKPKAASCGQTTLRMALDKADNALYQAKHQGRNQVCHQIEPDDNPT